MTTTRLPFGSAVAVTPLFPRCQSGVALRWLPQFKTLARWPYYFAILLAFPAPVFFDIACAQSNVVSHANDFTSIEYYPAPNQQQMKSRLSGAEAQPLPGGLLAIKQLRLEMFSTNGNTNIVVTAPECVYNQLDGTASSAGQLQVQTGDGKVRVEGEGFLWRQSDSFLNISNQTTKIELGTEQTN